MPENWKIGLGLDTYIDLKEQQYRHILEFEVQSFLFYSNRPFRIEELVSYWLDLYSIQSEQWTKYYSLRNILLRNTNNLLMMLAIKDLQQLFDSSQDHYDFLLCVELSPEWALRDFHLAWSKTFYGRLAICSKELDG